MSIKPIVDSVQAVLEIVIVAMFIIRIYVKKKKRISVKKYNRVIIICVICWLVLGISMQIISFSTLEAAMAFQGGLWRGFCSCGASKGWNSCI